MVELDDAAAHRVDDALVVRRHHTVVPVRLMRSRIRMIPTVVAGSRFPVGSSARRISGRFTKARGDRDPLLLTAGELVGEAAGLLRQADEVEDLRAPGCGSTWRGRPMTSIANATFS